MIILSKDHFSVYRLPLLKNTQNALFKDNYSS